MLCRISDDLLTYIKSFLARDIFALRTTNRRFLIEERNPNLLEVSLEGYLVAGVIPHNRRLYFRVSCDNEDTDVAKMADMSKKYRNLRVVSANHVPVVDISPLAGLPSYLEGGIHTLEMIEIDINNLPDISGIHTIDLRQVSLEYLEDFKSPGYKNGGTHTIKLEGTYIVDLSPLANLHTVILTECEIDDVSPLVMVQHIDLTESCIYDVSCFAGCDYRRGNTHTLILRGTYILHGSVDTAMANLLALDGLHTVDLRRSHTEKNEYMLQAIRDGDLLGRVHIIKLNGEKINRCLDGCIGKI